jgi:hypothetical protein
MQKLAPAVLVLTALAPLGASAATVQASLIPDGTYTAKVEKIDDAQHVTLSMNNGIETTVTPAPNVNFGKIKPNDTIMLSLGSGKVLVYKVQ